MRIRLVLFETVMLIVFSLLVCILATVSTNATYEQAAVQQSTFRLQLDAGRGDFFDCRFRRLTSNSAERWAAVAPTPESYRVLFEAVPLAMRPMLYENIQRSVPFLMPLLPEAQSVPATFMKTVRYGATPFASQMIGYCDAEGNGVAGLEMACDSLLCNGSTKRDISCAVGARGEFIDSAPPHILLTQGTGAGVMLTLDAALQRACEAIATEEMHRGCILVLETATGRVRASVSVPAYNPNHIADAVARDDTSFVNRAISAYNVGSVYKPLLAAAALESGLDSAEPYECTGSITVDGHTYRCAYGKGHGTVTMETAVAQSCNCYFIQLGAQLGGDTLTSYAAGFGFGESVPIYGALRTAKGNFPSAEELQNTGALASASFGQGTLLASPVQIACFMNTFANGGVYISPTFVEGLVNEYGQCVTQSLYAPVRRRVMSEETASQVCAMLVQVVENGLGQAAKPAYGGAGGKTGTAQTGRFNEQGEELMDAWFAGFYPAQTPRYTIVVLLDEETHTGDDACRVFARVADVMELFLDVEKSTSAKAEYPSE